jgi:hypothetical protein
MKLHQAHLRRKEIHPKDAYNKTSRTNILGISEVTGMIRAEMRLARRISMRL